jgi:hypothetical protein
VPPATTDIAGHITLQAGRGQRVAPGDLANTIVYFLPISGNVAPSPGSFTVFSHHHTFDPAAMAIPLGSTITFVNIDDVRHNEFSVTPGSAFTLGYQAPGQRGAHVFARGGLVLVGCLVHRAMELDLLVVPTRFVTRVAHDGHFSLHNLPPGPGTLYAWSPRARLQARAVDTPTRHDVDMRLSLVKPETASRIDVTTQP